MNSGKIRAIYYLTQKLKKLSTIIYLNIKQATYQVMQSSYKNDFEMSLHQTIIENLFDKRWSSENCNNMKLVSDKYKLLLNIYKKAKRNSVRAI